MENRITGVTSKGFEFDVDKDAINDMEVVDLLADFEENENPVVLSKLTSKVLGEKQKKALYESLRVNGRVPIIEVSNAMVEIFKAFGEQGKN